MGKNSRQKNKIFKKKDFSKGKITGKYTIAAI